MHELIPPTLIALCGALGFLLFAWKVWGKASLHHLLRAGLLVGMVDLCVELMGTYTGGWTYQRSLQMIFGTVPIELPILFTSSGVWLGMAHLIILKTARTSLALSLERVLLSVTSLALLLYVYQLSQDQALRMIVFTLPFGFWGFARLPSDQARAGAVLLATLTAIADWYIETWAVAQGNYGYAEGFTIETPLTYALLTLGFLGILEGRHINRRDEQPTSN